MLTSNSKIRCWPGSEDELAAKRNFKFGVNISLSREADEPPCTFSIPFRNASAVSPAHLQIGHPVVDDAKPGVSRVCTFPNFSNKLACTDAPELSAATDAVRCTQYVIQKKADPFAMV